VSRRSFSAFPSPSRRSLLREDRADRYSTAALSFISASRPPLLCCSRRRHPGSLLPSSPSLSAPHHQQQRRRARQAPLAGQHLSGRSFAQRESIAASFGAEQLSPCCSLPLSPTVVARPHPPPRASFELKQKLKLSLLFSFPAPPTPSLSPSSSPFPSLSPRQADPPHPPPSQDSQTHLERQWHHQDQVQEVQEEQEGYCRCRGGRRERRGAGGSDCAQGS
jgi:hypothetical protein